ncbi:MAG: BBP7 family outer membrane beta-barrel protein [Planctomycetales bacterium]|nr:BBP7 family outer membrane beta-barrel protein [Planctomycetales bacterium]
MRVQFSKSLTLALAALCVPSLAAAQSYLPLPQTSAPVYRSTSSYSQYDATTNSSLLRSVSTPPAAVEDTVASPSDQSSPMVGGGCASCDNGYAAPMMGKGKGCGASFGKGCGCGYGCGSSCGGSLACAAGLGGLYDIWGGRNCWYGGVYAMYLDRPREVEEQITVFDTNERDAILNNRSADMQPSDGWGLTLGRYICCGQAAMELTYWSVDPTAQSATVLDPNAIGAAPNLQTSYDLTTLNYDDGQGGGVNPIGNWFDGARAHRLTRDWDIDNLELNFVHHTVELPCGCNCVQISMLGGLRFFRFNENFLLESDDADTTFDGAPEEVRYQIKTDNDLYGLQLGTRADYYHNRCFGLHLGVKFGVYANNMDHSSFIGGSQGAAWVGAGPNANRDFAVHSTETDIAFLGEIDLGASYRFSNCWRAKAGYRIMSVSGVALTTEQVPVYFQDIDGVAEINHSSCLLLHGGYAGLEYCF